MAIKPIRPEWKGRMTPKERFNRQMHFQEVDRTVNQEFGYWEENYKTWAMLRDNGIKNEHEAYRFFGFDRGDGIGANLWMSPAFEVKEISRNSHYSTIINEDGLMAEVPLDGHTTMPHFLKPSIVTPDDWFKVKKERFQIDDSRRHDIDALKRAHPEGGDLPLGVGTGSMIGKIRDMLTVEGLAYACSDYPDMVEDMVETACRLVEHSLDQLLPHFQFDSAGGWEDICCNKGPLVTLKFFREVVVPRYKRIHNKLMDHGVDIWMVDCDGDVRPLLPDFLESGINCLYPFEVNGCAHPGELLTQYDKKLRIFGGFDKMKLIAGRAATKEYMESLVPFVARGGFIPAYDHHVSPDVSEQDYLYYLDLKEELFGMKD